MSRELPGQVSPEGQVSLELGQDDLNVVPELDLLIEHETVRNRSCLCLQKTTPEITYELQRLEDPDLNIFRELLIELRDKCKRYDGAHSYTRNINVLGDKVIKLSILILSSLTTYSIASHSDVILEEDLETDKLLTLSTTLVSGLNAIFNFSDKAEIHKAIISDYVRLSNEITKYITMITNNTNNTKLDDVIAEYSDFYDRFNTGNDKTVSIGLMICAKRKYKII